MEIKANLKHLRMSAQKTRLVADVVRKMPVEKALDQLKFINKLVAKPIATLINSAVANAENTYSLERNNLYIKEIKVDEGLTLKRWMPRAHGRATTIRKRGCHINLVLAEIKESGKAKKKEVKTEEPVKLEQLAKEGEKEIKKGNDKSKTPDAKADKKAKSTTAKKATMFQRKAG
jgi:large subunit ribosomal protein L22